MNNIEQTKIKDTTFALAEKFPTLWQEIQEIQRSEEELAEKRTVERTTEILKERLSEIKISTENVDLEQLSIEFMY